MAYATASFVAQILLLLSATWAEQPPEGYYAFIEAPNMEPPRVRRPPYQNSDKECPGVRNGQHQKSLNNLCGDLNKGYIPRNPLGQHIQGQNYPFELIKNKTLEFFSRTLPLLKADETLPKVAKFRPEDSTSNELRKVHRVKRDAAGAAAAVAAAIAAEQIDTSSNVRNRESRKFCDNGGGGVLCMFLKALNVPNIGGSGIERREDSTVTIEQPEFRRGEAAQPPSTSTPPPTPCPAKVEYATPVFAKNYQGVWRYIVQIPYEGYFTQTVEVTRCMQSRCHYMDGGCVSSPRWVSMLVAEMYYPDTFLPSAGTPTHLREPVNVENPPPVHDFQNYQQYLHKRAGTPEMDMASNYGVTTSSSAPTSSPTHSSKTSNAGGKRCDGTDEIGCFQVRLYYDWFLVPGSCKCWRPDYFSRYIRRKVVGSDL